MQKTRVVVDSMEFRLEDWARPSRFIQNLGMLHTILIAVEPFSVLLKNGVAGDLSLLRIEVGFKEFARKKAFFKVGDGMINGIVKQV